MRNRLYRGLADYYYGRSAERYEVGRAKQEEWRKQDRAVKAALSTIDAEGPVSAVLDLPCGTGRWIPLFADQPIDYTGVDVSADMIVEARKKLTSDSKLVACFTQADVFAYLPNNPQRWDLVISTRFLQFWGTRPALTILRGLCGATTRWILVDVSYRNMSAARELMHPSRVRHQTTKRWNRMRGGRATQAHARRKLLAVLNAEGFTVIRSVVTSHNRWNTREMWLARRDQQLPEASANSR